MWVLASRVPLARALRVRDRLSLNVLVFIDLFADLIIGSLIIDSLIRSLTIKGEAKTTTSTSDVEAPTAVAGGARSAEPPECGENDLYREKKKMNDISALARAIHPLTAGSIAAILNTGPTNPPRKAREPTSQTQRNTSELQQDTR